MIKTVENCRLCGSSNIPIIWDFGLNPIANNLKNKEDLDKDEFQAPLRYFKCSDCHSVQLKDEINSDILFQNYLYESPPNLIPHFKELAKTTTERLSIRDNACIMDIGSNNGLLLQEFKNLGHRVVGFEPCDRIAQKARDKGIGTFNQFFNGGSGEEFALQYRCPDLITSTNCFAHTNLIEFMDGLEMVMGANTYFVFENCYLLDTLKNMDLGQAYFEHIFMHSITPLVKFFDKWGFDFFDVEYNNVQMGSIRGYVRRKENTNIHFEIPPTIRAYNIEAQEGLLKQDIYKRFVIDVDWAKLKLIDKLEEIKENGGTVCLYALPAKMCLINKYFGLEPYIDYVVEESLVKVGKFAPGTRLEIKDVEYFRNNPTTHCIIGAYNFEKDIKNKHSWYQGEWILPLNA